MAERTYLGCETTMSTEKDQDVARNMAAGVRYSVARMIHSQNIILGRGPSGFLVEYGSERFVGKDLWIASKRIFHEELALKEPRDSIQEASSDSRADVGFIEDAKAPGEGSPTDDEATPGDTAGGLVNRDDMKALQEAGIGYYSSLPDGLYRNPSDNRGRGYHGQ